MKDSDANSSVPAFTLDDMIRMFPTTTSDGYSYTDFSYDPIFDALGEVVCSYRDKDYQGETTLVIRNKTTGLFAIHTYSWGSCSGCDFMQGCSSHAAVLKYANEAAASLEWIDLESLRARALELSSMKDDLDYPMHHENASGKAIITWIAANTSTPTPERPTP